jgi:hypothetical protein
LELLEDRSLPSTFIVTNLTDHDPGSLRDAISQAASGDTISFADGLRGTITLTSGELAITRDLDIEGPGASVITVDGNGQSRVFDVFRQAHATLAGLTITNGQVRIAGTNVDLFAFGGGIDNAGTLALSQCTVSRNQLVPSLTNTSGNLHLAYSYGAGLYNSGTATVADCTFTGNVAVWSYSSSGFGSISDGRGHGGAIANAGLLTITDSILDNNTGVGNGGGLYNSGIVAASGSTFSNNLSGTGGGSTGIPTNTYSYGGGIDNDVGTLDLTNCTVANNSVSNDLTISGASGQATSAGGGIQSLGELSMTNCTVAGNTVSATAHGSASALAQGGGIYIDPYSPHGGQLVNTLVAGNSSNMSGPDAFGPFASLGHNLVGKTDGSNGWIGSDLTGTAANPLNPLLGTLGNHGGPTQTIPLLAGSPALHTADPAFAPPADQRGVPRGALPNIGAFEATADHLTVSGPINVAAGVPFNVTVTAVDPFGELAVGYTGVVDLSSSDTQAPFLGEYAFTPTDAGQYTFTGVVLYTPGIQTISATDDSGLTGSYNLLVQ